MYPIAVGFDGALNRIDALLKNGHSAEGLLTSVFTFEKLMRRSVKLAIISRGFSSKQSEMLTKGKGYRNLEEMWPVFDPSFRTLRVVVGDGNWKELNDAVTMRNKLVHGNAVYKLERCHTYAGYVVKALRTLHNQITTEYGRDPWTKMPIRRKAQLEWFGFKNVKRAPTMG